MHARSSLTEIHGGCCSSSEVLMKHLLTFSTDVPLQKAAREEFLLLLEDFQHHLHHTLATQAVMPTVVVPFDQLIRDRHATLGALVRMLGEQMGASRRRRKTMATTPQRGTPHGLQKNWTACLRDRGPCGRTPCACSMSQRKPQIKQNHRISPHLAVDGQYGHSEMDEDQPNLPHRRPSDNPPTVIAAKAP